MVARFATANHIASNVVIENRMPLSTVQSDQLAWRLDLRSRRFARLKADRPVIRSFGLGTAKYVAK
jgi:hypothetical protein